MAPDANPPDTDRTELEGRWNAASAHPDLHEDLGYEVIDLDVLVTSNNDQKMMMMLPRATDWTKDDVYIVGNADLLADPAENR